MNLRASPRMYSAYVLTRWELTSVDRDVPSAADIGAAVTVNDKAGEIKFRMMLQTVDNIVALPSDEGATWRLAIWAPDTFFSGTE